MDIMEESWNLIALVKNAAMDMEVKEGFIALF